MKKMNRTYAQAEEIAERKINLYLQMVNIMFASKCGFDEDIIEAELSDNDDAILYFETQDELKAAFSIHSDVFKRFAKIRYVGGTDVKLTPIFERLASKLRVKSYNLNCTASYKVGGYSKMYIYNQDAFIDLCLKWHESEGQDEIFDFTSPMYDEVRDVFVKHYNTPMLDHRKNRQ